MKLDYTKYIKRSLVTAAKKEEKKELKKGDRSTIAKAIRATRKAMGWDKLGKEEVEKAVDKIVKVIKNAAK